MYVTPATSRLIAGTGAVVKSDGEGRDRRVLSELATVHGAIDGSARQTRGYWEPPIPATVDVGLGTPEQQLPRTTMGAIVALNELLDAARTGDTGTPYGPYAPGNLAALVEAKTPWLLRAQTADEIRALLDWAKTSGMPLVLDGAAESGSLADDIAAAGVPVIFESPFSQRSRQFDRGKSEDAEWPDYAAPAALAKAGARVAISARSGQYLHFAARAASKGGLNPAAALRAITLTPAELLGVAGRVGSIQPGKDADFVVLNGAPMSDSASVLATWVDGEISWKAHESTAVVIEVEELHVGDGQVLRPGQILMLDDRIAEVGSSVAHPRGATVVRGSVAMPGMIDAYGYLGLEGSTKVPGTDFPLSSIVGPGDRADRRVASAGVTTVVLTPRNTSSSGAPAMAYKPAAAEHDRQVVGETVAVSVSWPASNRIQSGDSVRELLAKGAAYREDWMKYEKAMASYTPPPPAPAKETDDAEEEDAEEDEEKKDDDGDKKKKKKKKEKEPLPPDPLTGIWTAELALPPASEPAGLRLQLDFAAGKDSGDVSGHVRCALVSDDLVELEGYWDREASALNLAGLGSRGWVSLALTCEEKGKLSGSLVVGGNEAELALAKTPDEVRVARRPDRKVEQVDKPRPPKGAPKRPKFDAKLEPIRRAIDGQGAIVVSVDRADEILACVDAFARHGIRPILLGADDAWKVADEISGRVSGVLLSTTVLRRDVKLGTEAANRFAELQAAGIPVAFPSRAEEGAADLPVTASFAISQGMSATGALRALTSDAARMMRIDGRVGRLATGLDADVLLLDGPPLASGTSVLRAWVNGVEVIE
jgi:imidazolonepropionase-like amidohydrolase